MKMKEIKSLIEKSGYIIESSENDINFLNFYCHKDGKRFFISIKQK